MPCAFFEFNRQKWASTLETTQKVIHHYIHNIFSSFQFLIKKLTIYLESVNEEDCETVDSDIDPDSTDDEDGDFEELDDEHELGNELDSEEENNEEETTSLDKPRTYLFIKNYMKLFMP